MFYKIHKYQYLQYLELVYQDFLLITKTDGTILDCIEHVGNSNYPFLSNKFKIFIKEINEGETPENLLLQFITFISNKSFENRMISILNKSINLSDDRFELNDEFSIELVSNYQKYVNELETRLITIITINIFTPIITITLFSIYFSINPISIFILIPIHYLLIHIMKASLIKKEMTFFGQDSRDNLDDLLTFLIIFSNYLEKNISPEIALIKSIIKMNYNLNFKELYNYILFNDIKFRDLWERLLDIYKDDDSKSILEFIYRILIKNSLESSKRIKIIIKNIELNRKIIEKRNLIYKSLQFKVSILLFIFSVLMGIISYIIPFLSQIFKIFLFNDINFNINFLFEINNFLIILNISIIIFINSYSILSIIKQKDKLIKSFIFLGLYLFSFYLVFTFFNYTF